jgi:hypothetical protein
MKSIKSVFGNIDGLIHLFSFRVWIAHKQKHFSQLQSFLSTWVCRMLVNFPQESFTHREQIEPSFYDA